MTIAIEFLYFEDCPSHERALELLEEAIHEQGIAASIRICKVETDEQAETLRFPGSPTIRVAGKDIEDLPDIPFGLACRVYRHPNGKISPLPPREKIIEALQHVARAS